MARPDLAALSSQASDLLKLAQEYRDKIKDLPESDPTRKELEGVIIKLLDQVDSLSRTVRDMAAKP